MVHAWRDLDDLPDWKHQDGYTGVYDDTVVKPLGSHYTWVSDGASGLFAVTDDQTCIFLNLSTDTASICNGVYAYWVVLPSDGRVLDSRVPGDVAGIWEYVPADEWPDGMAGKSVLIDPNYADVMVDSVVVAWRDSLHNKYGNSSAWDLNQEQES